MIIWTQKIELYAKKYPITTALVGLNLVVFLLNHSGLIYPVVVYPGMLNLYTFFGHFSHLSLMHIGFNVAVLIQIGPLIEQRLTRLKFMFVVVTIWLALVGGGLIWLSHPSLGFSGIGLGLLAFAGLLYRREKKFSQSLLGWVTFNVVLGFLPQISFLMHFLGAVVGVLLGLIIKSDYEEMRIRRRF